MPVALVWNLLSSSAISVRWKRTYNYILMKYPALRWGWCLNSPGSAEPLGKAVWALGSAFHHCLLAWGCWAGTGYFLWPHAVGRDPHSPFDSARLSVVEPTTVPIFCPPNWVPNVYLLKHLGICNHAEIKTNVWFKTSSENHHKITC